MGLKYKMHDWLADNFKSIQYPDIKPANKPKWVDHRTNVLIKVDEHTGIEKLNLTGKFVVLVASSVLLVIGLAVLSIAVFILYELIASWF